MTVKNVNVSSTRINDITAKGIKILLRGLTVYIYLARQAVQGEIKINVLDLYDAIVQDYVITERYITNK